VLLIGHQFQVPSEGQAKAAALACEPRIQVHVISPSRYKEGETHWRFPRIPEDSSYGFDVANVRNAWSGPAKWYLHWYGGLRKTLERLKPDVIDLWEEPWSLISAQVSNLCRTAFPNTAFVGETEQNILKHLPPPFEWFRSYSFARMNFLICRNLEAENVARSKHFVGPARVVGNGVDVDVFKPQDKNLCRLKAGVEGFVVGYAGRLIEAKGLRVLLEAFRKIRGPKCLLLSGDGPLLKPLLEEPFVKWAGCLPREQLPEFYGALDVLVLPSLTTASWKEQFGRVLVEAQACGIPVVGSDSGAIPEVISNAGLVSPEGDVNALSILLEKLRSIPSLCSDLALAGRKRVELCYSWAAIAAQMTAVYEEAAHFRSDARS
jgi:glycosyltransferase involved in cell wall biosynthesis